MKKNLLSVLLIAFLFPFISSAQEKDTLAPAQKPARTQAQTPDQPPAPVPITQQQQREPNHINSGFYLKLGPNFPLGNFLTCQKRQAASENYPSVYYTAKMGAAMDMGFLIYIGPAFANNHLRLGLDATFISFSFNPITADTIPSPNTQYWYYFLGQKFGPVISVCPIDRLVIDFSYKMNAYVAYLHHSIRGKLNDEWGKNLTQNEISMNIRYSFMLFSFQYNFGQVTYNDFDSGKPNHYVDNTTFRFLIGFKF
jgi:hypothetical protein